MTRKRAIPVARIVAGIACSHVPAIGVAMDRGVTATPYWESLFKGYEPARQWLAKLAPDVAIIVYNDHASAFSGLAHKCIFTGTLLAGGPRPPPDGDRRRPPPVGYAWIAPIGPGGEMLLVRVAFSTPTGSLTFYLDQRQVQKF